MRDLHQRLACAASINIAARASTVNGSGVDLQGYDGALVAVVVGAWAGNQGTWAITLEDSPNNSTFTAVAAGDRVGSNITMSGFVNRAGGASLEQSYVGTQRYLRAVATLTGGGTNCTFGVIIVRGYPRVAPST